MIIEKPLSILRYTKSIAPCNRAMAYLRLDASNTLIGMGGALAQCGIPSLEIGSLVNEKLPALAQLFPLGEQPLIIVNTQLSEDFIIDIHLFADVEGQWVVVFDNTAEGLKLQTEQQERLCKDILKEKSRKSNGT